MLSKVKFACFTPWSEFSDFVQKLFVNFAFFKSVKILFIHRNLLISFMNILSHILLVCKVQQGLVLNGFWFLKKPCLIRLMKTVLQGFFCENREISAYNQPHTYCVFDSIHNCNSKVPSPCICKVPKPRSFLS